MKKSFILLLIIFISNLAYAETSSSIPLSTAELIKLLQAGGNIIYMRHGPTDHNQKDQDRHKLNNCSTQRNLSPQGRKQVQNTGNTIRRLNIPIAKVSSSPYCRCKETAELAFGKFSIEPDLHFSISKNEHESDMLGKRLHEMMINADTSSGNVVFVGHTSNLRDGMGIWPKPEGVISVFKKNNNKIIYKGMITPNAWPAPSN